MAGEPFSRKRHVPLEKVVSADFNAQQDQAARGLLDTLRHLNARGLSASRSTAQFRSGFVGNSFKVYPASPGASMAVRLTPGVAFQDAAGLSNPMPAGENWRTTDYSTHEGVNDYGYNKPLYLDAYAEITVPAAPSGAEGEFRYDLIEVRCGRRLADTETPEILNTTTGEYAAGSELKTLRFDLDGDVGTVNEPAASTNRISLKKGSDIDTSPTPPAVTTGYMAVAYIRVGTTTTTIDYDRILDERAMVFPLGQSSGMLNFTVSDVAATAPASLTAYVPPGIEVYVVAHASTAGTVWVYLLGDVRAGMTVTSGSGTQFLCSVERAIITLDQTDPDVTGINSARNAVGATKVTYGQKAVRFELHVAELDTVGAPGTIIPITGAVDVNCVLGIWS